MKTKTNQSKFEKQLYAVSSYLKELRYAENLTQKEVGNEAGLNKNTISNIENCHDCKLSSLFQLCKFFQISPSELMSIIED